MFMLQIFQKKKAGIFLALAVVSLFALANTDLDTARTTLTRTLENWRAFTPDSRDQEELSFEDAYALHKQQEFANKAKAAVKPYISKLPTADLDELSGIGTITQQVIQKDNWAKGLDAARRANQNTNRALETLNSKNFSDANEAPFQTNAKPASHGMGFPPLSDTLDGSFLNELAERLNEQKATVLKLPSRTYLKNPQLKKQRQEIDKDFIQTILTHSFDHNDLLSLFAKRLTAANQAASEDFEALYAELMLLHLYLRPEYGLRLLDLGLKQESKMKPTSDRDRRYEEQAAMELPAELRDQVANHTANLRHSLAPGNAGIANLSQALQTIITRHLSQFMVFDDERTPVAVILTSVLFDLFNYSESAQTASDLASHLSWLGLLWDYRTCWYASSKPHGEELANECFSALSNTQIKKLSDKIEREITSQRPYNLNKQNDHVAHQWSYGAAAIRLMNNVPVIPWTRAKR